MNIYIYVASRLTGLTPLLYGVTPHVGGLLIIASSLSPPSFLFRYTPTRHTAQEEGRRLQLPAAEGSGTFQPLRPIPIESESSAGSQVSSCPAAAV